VTLCELRRFYPHAAQVSDAQEAGHAAAILNRLSADFAAAKVCARGDAIARSRNAISCVEKSPV
jgi:hypothetical protein